MFEEMYDDDGAQQRILSREREGSMGKLIYGTSDIEIDDRTLAHLKIVMLTKLRRNESFAFSHVNSVAAGSGRLTVWMNPAVPLEFHFHGSRSPELNREWVEALLSSANSPEGLRVLPEHPHE